MSLRPPSSSRLRAAREAGFRPAGAWFGVAFVALMLAGILPAGLANSGERLAGALAQAFDPNPLDSLAAPRPGWVLAVLGSIVGLAIVRALVRPRVPLRTGFDARRARLPIATTIALSLLALVLCVWSSSSVLAGAARSVDASPGSLALVWVGWLERTLVTVACVAAVVGALEWLLESRRLWLALHLTPGQVRAEAREHGQR